MKLRARRLPVTLPSMIPEARGGGFNLVFDADDTLWDSNIHFLEAEAAFLETLCTVHPITHPEIRAALRNHELRIIEDLGYGRRPYVTALHRVIADLMPSDCHDRVRIEVERIGERLLTRHCDLLPGVEETLSELAQRHRLMLFTKGQPDEQMAKLEKSGLRPLFSRIGIPVEKNESNYRLFIAQAELDPARTVMIGNSPRSDINPSLRAGFRAAVFIPHPHTWELEHEALDYEDERVISITGFPHLLNLF